MYLIYGLIIVLVIVLLVLVNNNSSNIGRLPKIRVYASFTSIPPRLNNTEKTIKNILNQTYPIEQIIMNIPNGIYKRTGEEYFIPKYLDKYLDKVNIVRCPEYGPATKLLGGLNFIDDDVYIYVIDDDMEYPKNHLEKLVGRLTKDTDCVSNTFCHYNTTLTNTGVCGYSGFLVRKAILDGIYDYFDKLPKVCLTVDDIWISKFLQDKKAKIKHGTLINNIGLAAQARLKDLVMGDKTSLSNTVNSKNLWSYGSNSNNTKCENALER